MKRDSKEPMNFIEQSNYNLELINSEVHESEIIPPVYLNDKISKFKSSCFLDNSNKQDAL
jgi:hypothetical protein